MRLYLTFSIIFIYTVQSLYLSYLQVVRVEKQSQPHWVGIRSKSAGSRLSKPVSAPVGHRSISSFKVLAIHLEKMKFDIKHLAASIIAGMNRKVLKSPGISLSIA